MNWEKKYIKTCEQQKIDDNLNIYFDYSTNGADKYFIDSLIKQFPFIPQSYKRFLEISDGAEINMIVFYGTEDSEFNSINWLIDLCKLQIDLKHHYPFAKDADGSIFYIRDDGNIIWESVDDPDTQTNLAKSFDAFMDNVLFGEDYSKLNPFGIEDDDEWFEFLKKMKWIN